MGRVLVVEDDPTIVKVITTCLQLDQHQVRTAGDLQSGVRLLRGQPADLVVTDLFADPFSTDALGDLAVLTEVAPGIPIVVTTAHAQAATCDPAEYGLAAILLKPFSAHDLRAVVQDVLMARPQARSRPAYAEPSWGQQRATPQHIADCGDLLEPPGTHVPGSGEGQPIRCASEG